MATAIQTAILAAATAKIMPTTRRGSLLINGTFPWMLAAPLENLCFKDGGPCKGADSGLRDDAIYFPIFGRLG